MSSGDVMIGGVLAAVSTSASYGACGCAGPPHAAEVDEASLGSRTRGVWTRRTALTALTAGEIDARLRSGRWQSPWAGVYADAGHVLDHAQRAVAAVLASRPLHGPNDVVVCGRTAARLHRLPLVDDDDPATGRSDHRHDHVTAPRSLPTLRRGGRVLHRHQLVLAPGTSYVAAVRR